MLTNNEQYCSSTLNWHLEFYRNTLQERVLIMFSKITHVSKLSRVYKCLYFNIRMTTRVPHKKKNQFYDPNYETSIHGSTPSGKVGGRHLVTMAKGVGTGPELMEALKAVFRSVNAPVMFEELEIEDEAGEDDMDNMVLSIMRNGVAVKGNIEKCLRPITTPRDIELVHRLDLYTNMMEFKSFPGVKHRNKLRNKIDIAIVRQNTEGEFAMLEHDLGRGIQHLNVTTRFNTGRLARFAFKHAIQHKKRRVLTVYNKGVHEHGEALFINTCKEVAKEYPSMPHAIQTIGSFLRTISRDEYYNNVIIASSLGGEMISSILGGYIGSSALICGCNFGERYAVFEAGARQRGHKLKGRNLVNPTAMLMTGVNLLRYLKQDSYANIIEKAVQKTINVDLVLTRDLGGTASTTEMVDGVVNNIIKKTY